MCVFPFTGWTNAMYGKQMSKQSDLSMWEPNAPTTILRSASPQEIAEQAKALTSRDIQSISMAFNAGSYEMVSTFVWTRAITGLKKQIASLGMEFVGEMLGRPDITQDSDPKTAISEYDAVSLAEDLGMVNATEALRLKHALNLVAHFSDPENASKEQMNVEEAVGVLRSCVTSILGNPHIEPPIQFAELRKTLEEESLLPNDLRVTQIVESPYFIQRTTLSVLLSLLKTANSAQLEHVIGNINVLLPKMWAKLGKPEKWQVGQTYAEVHAAGKHAATVGLKNALSVVQGFDYVPETLRSDTFAKAAHKLMEVHFSMNNFYNEGSSAAELVSLGSTIPKPAFPVCMTAILCVRLGNYYGIAWNAQDSANEILNALRKEQWEYYLNECLPNDKTILDKLEDPKPATRWTSLCEEFALAEKRIQNPFVAELTSASSHSQVQTARKKIRKAVRD